VSFTGFAEGLGEDGCMVSGRDGGFDG